MNNISLDGLKEKLVKAGLLPLESQARLSTEVLRNKLETVLPQAMEKSGVDFWLVIGKEYNEDPVMQTLFTWDMPHARRVSALFFYYDRSAGKVRRMSAGTASPEMNKLYENIKAADETVIECVTRIIHEYNPGKIAIDRSNNQGICDGMSASLYGTLMNSLEPEYRQKLCGAESLMTRWLQTITDLELELMKAMVDVTQDIIRLSFSNNFVRPGVTSTTDIEWFMRSAISRLGFDYWFGPDVDLQRKGSSSSRISESVVEPGDLLHCDIGISGKYVRLNTDLQWLAYVRKPGEEHAPEGLVKLLAYGNRFQDIVTANFKAHLTGNDIYTNAIEQAKQEGLKPMLYTHPLGTFGHGVGPLIGLYDAQGSVPIRGERPVENNTCFALELNICGNLPEWNDQEVYAYLEEDIYFAKKASYIHGRQTELIEI